MTDPRARLAALDREMRECVADGRRWHRWRELHAARRVVRGTEAKPRGRSAEEVIVDGRLT